MFEYIIEQQPLIGAILWISIILIIAYICYKVGKHS